MNYHVTHPDATSYFASDEWSFLMLTRNSIGTICSVVFFFAILSFASVTALSAATSQIVCPQSGDNSTKHTESQCSPSTPTPKPTPKTSPSPKSTPIIKGDPMGGGTNQGYDFHAIESFTPGNFYDCYVEVAPNPGFEVNSSDPQGFQTDEIWRTDGPQSTNENWQEGGYVAGQLLNAATGATQNTYFTGLFAAYMESSSGYVEFEITTNPQTDPTGPADGGPGIAIGTETNNAYLVDINYNSATYATASANYNYSSDIDVGVESSSQNPQVYGFTNEVNLLYPQYYTGTGYWNYWPASGNNVTPYNQTPDGIPYCGYISSDDEYTPNEPFVECFGN